MNLYCEKQHHALNSQKEIIICLWIGASERSLTLRVIKLTGIRWKTPKLQIFLARSPLSVWENHNFTRQNSDRGTYLRHSGVRKTIQTQNTNAQTILTSDLLITPSNPWTARCAKGWSELKTWSCKRSLFSKGKSLTKTRLSETNTNNQPTTWTFPPSSAAWSIFSKSKKIHEFWKMRVLHSKLICSKRDSTGYMSRDPSFSLCTQTISTKNRNSANTLQIWAVVFPNLALKSRHQNESWVP